MLYLAIGLGVACVLLMIAGGIAGYVLSDRGDDDSASATGSSAAPGSGVRASAPTPPADQPDAKAAPAATASNAKGGSRLTIDLPERAEVWGTLPVTVSGSTGPIEDGIGGASVAVYITSGEERDRPCSSRIPDGEEADHWGGSLIEANVYGAGPFRAAGNQVSPSKPGTYRVCGWVEPFPSDEASKKPSLVVSTTLRVRDAPLPDREGFGDEMEPGVYAASGSAIDDAPAGTRIEFEVKRQEGGLAVAYIAATNLPTGACNAAGTAQRKSAFSDVPDLASMGLLGEAVMKPELTINGGSPGRGEYHGLIATRPAYDADCPGHLAFVAKRVASGEHTLRDQLKR